MKLIQAGWFRLTLLPYLLEGKSKNINLYNDKEVKAFASKHSDKMEKFIGTHWSSVKRNVIAYINNVENIKILFYLNTLDVTADKIIASLKIKGYYTNPKVMKILVDQGKIATKHPRLYKQVGGGFICPNCNLLLKRGHKECPYCKKDPIHVFKKEERNKKVQELMQELIKFLSDKIVKGEEFSPEVSEQEFENVVNKIFSKKKIPLGIDKNDKEWFLLYDFSSVAYDEIQDRWRVSSIWFNVENEDKKSKFSFWKQPVLDLYKENKFSPKMKKWIMKKYNLKNINNLKISNYIQKLVKSIGG